MHKTIGIAIVLTLISGFARAVPLDTCEDSYWLPVDASPPNTPECVAYDGSRIPDCTYFLNNHTSYFHVHEYNCSRFWECSPEGPCLFECADCGSSQACSGFDGLVFDCRYQYPDGPVCDWPTNVNCTNHYPCLSECCSDEDCPSGQCVDGSCVAQTTTTPCLSECCSDDDCPSGQCVDGSCVAQTTTAPCLSECCSDDDCPTGQCVDGSCVDPGCKTDDDCESAQWCDTSVNPGECKPGCRSTEDCTAMTCSQCEDHQCADPECCSDEDCPTGYCSPNGTCEGECNDNGDCQTLLSMTCSVCQNYTCSQPECCADADCPAGYICQDNACVPEPECNAEKPCGGANNICDLPNYSNCEWCDMNECKPGCEDDSNCAGDMYCSGHECHQKGINGVVNITIATHTCSQCEGAGNPLGTKEGGLKVMLLGDYGTSCESNGLDNLERVDYDNGKTAFFDGAPADDADDDGLGGCKLADLNYGLTGGSATWTGSGEWIAVDSQAVCINFYDTTVTCCCELKQKTLSTDETSELDNCLCVQ